jgi:hypothetical protein
VTTIEGITDGASIGGKTGLTTGEGIGSSGVGGIIVGGTAEGDSTGGRAGIATGSN